MKTVPTCCAFFPHLDWPLEENLTEEKGKNHDSRAHVKSLWALLY